MADGIRPAKHLDLSGLTAMLSCTLARLTAFPGDTVICTTFPDQVLRTTAAEEVASTSQVLDLLDGMIRRETALRALLAQAEEVLERAASTLVQPGTPTPQFCESVSADIRRALAAVREGR